SWDNQRPSVKLLVVGIAVKNFRESETFYEQKLGFRVAFKLSSPDGKPTSIYYYVSRDSFLEMQPATPEMPPGLTHVHMLTDDLDATVARLRKAGLASGARNAMTPNTMTEVGVAGNMKNASVFDPNGVRLELDELLPGSLLKKAMESWK
ncbi:MAG: VOC family protein, partial [Acidobacteriota bacterium]|nr:VOC family protein [Acidobacteriota bacterium]